MKITELMKKKTLLSFEVFPPKTDKGLDKLNATLEDLYRWSPDYVSCTYGAGGTAKGYNLEICRSIGQSGRTMPLSHYTCVHHTREQIRADMDEYLEMGVDHFLALRGDFAPGENATNGDFDHATQLIEYLRSLYGNRITIACTGIPEGHMLSEDMIQDIAFLKKKQDLGADFITTQLTYDMDQFRRWLDQVRAAGIDLPVAVGVMPVLDRDKCIRYCISMNGSAIPRSLARLISKYYNDPEGFRDAGMDYTVRQMYEYLSIGIQDLHIFTLNQSEAMNEILKRSGLFSENGR